MRNSVLVGSREAKKKENNFRGDGVSNSVSHEEGTENTWETDAGGVLRGVSGEERFWS